MKLRGVSLHFLLAAQLSTGGSSYTLVCGDLTRGFLSLSLSCGVMSTAVMYACMDECAYVCFRYRKEMGRWTLHLSVGLGLLAVLLTCCCAEGEESELINSFFFNLVNYV